MKLLSTFTSADKTRKSTVSIVDEQTYAVEFFHKDKLSSYAYYDAAQHADSAAEQFIIQVDSK